MEGFSTPDERSDRVVLEANEAYWDPTRFPQLQRIIFDNTLEQEEAVELVKTGEGRVDLVTGLSPLDTLRVARSPFANVVKNRKGLRSALGFFNIRKPDSPWRDVRVRQAVNFAMKRADLIRYAAKGNGVIVPALLPAHSPGYDPDLPPYSFDPATARQLLHEAGYADGLSLTLIASDDLVIQATVIGKMLEQVGLTVDLRILNPTALFQEISVGDPEQQSWDIALWSGDDWATFPLFTFYHFHALDGPSDWVIEQPELRHLYEQGLGTVEPDAQREIVRQMERHTSEQAYFLFLYNPIPLYAVNTAVEFVPYVNMFLILAETSVTDQHWSVREGQKAAIKK